MRVLYFYQYFTTPKGSYGTRAYEFARRWVRAGDAVTVVSTVYDKSDLRAAGLISRILLEGIEVRILNIRVSNKHSAASRVLTFVAYALLACWYALTLRADVVIASSPPITAGVPGLVARWLRGRRFVFEVRDPWPDALVEMGVLRNAWIIRAARAFEWICYRSAHQVIAVSEGIAGWMRDRHGLDQVKVVPNACDNDLAWSIDGSPELPAWASRKQLVLYTGQMGFSNHCGQILDMAARLRDSGARNDVAIVLIGDGRERGALEQKARQMQLHCVHFVGQVPKEEVFRWLRKCCCALLVFRDAYLVASGSPNKMFDAFAAGVPIIHNTRGWIKDFVDREQCGISVPPGDPQAMADAVMALTRDPVLRERLGRNAQRVARELFDRDLLAGRMREILHDCVRRG